jgi:hypothetical protein
MAAGGRAADIAIDAGAASRTIEAKFRAFFYPSAYLAGQEEEEEEEEEEDED